ncbi:MAG: hypothetical protein GWP08_00700 [Nitrospiraceae bacterium]|nr:hypothetical protein [Nitrospiraceae bacterium]
MPYLAGVVLLATMVGAYGQDADFGDLPDPGFPTLRASASAGADRTGPYHLNTTHEWIGLGPGGTTIEPDAKVIDMDEDDAFGLITIDNMYEQGIFMQMGQVSVPVTTDSDPAIRYLNVAADLNEDGQFESFYYGPDLQWEWLACNVPVIFQDETKSVTSRFVLVTPLATTPCLRATLTTVPIDPALFGVNGWDGSGPVGGFARGETEDQCPGAPPDTIMWESWQGVELVPPANPPARFPEWNPPPPSAPVSQRPRAAEPPPFPLANGPAEPFRPDPTTTPLRADDQPLAAPSRDDVNKMFDMPDIKPGPNGCVPAATANSIRYLMDQAGLTPEGNGGEINRGIQEELKRAMETTPENGTAISPDQPDRCKFLQGAARANLPNGVGERLVTTVQSNPSAADICKAAAEGKGVEIVIARFDGPGINPPQNPQGHMVTVVGCVKRPDGTYEFKYHDPEDLRQGDNPGDTVFPPREHSLIVANGGLESDRGGLRIIGAPGRYEGIERIHYVAYVFVEEIAEEGDLGAEATSDSQRCEAGQSVTLRADIAGKADGYTYQWLKDGLDIPQGTSDTLTIPALMPENEGAYSCWVYDGMGTFQTTPPINIAINEPLPTPIKYGPLLAAVLMLGVAVLVFERQHKHS